MAKLNIPFEVELDLLKTSEEDGEWYVEGFCGSTEIDLQGDIITEDAFRKSEKDLLENSTVLWNHDVDEVVGKIVESEARKEGLWVKVLISKTVPDIWQRIKEGVINKFSIRGKIIDAIKKFIKDLGRVANVINEMYLVEASLVSLPANPAAKTLRWYISKSLTEYFSKGGEIPNYSSLTIGKGDAMTEILELLTKMSDRLIADEDKALIETLKAKIKEKYPYPYPKKKSGENWTQEEIDSLQAGLEKAKKPKKVEELEEEEEKGIVALSDEIRKQKKEKYPYPKKPAEEMTEEEEKELISLSDEIRKQKKEKYPYPEYPKKKSGEAYTQEEIDNLEKISAEASEKISKLEAETKGLKADSEIEKRWSKIKDEYDEKDAPIIKGILKKSILGLALTPDEAESLIEKQVKTSHLFISNDSSDFTKNLPKDKKEELLKLGGIRTRFKS